MSPEQRVDWIEELQDESVRNFYYVVTPNPDGIRTLITAAVYRTLAGHDLSDRETGRFMAGSDFKDEETEILARGLFDQVRKISEANGYHDEWNEAKEQGEKAAQNIQRGAGFMASYDYWALRPIKSSIRLDTLTDSPDHLLLSGPLPEIGELRGIPDNLLTRRYSAEDAARKNLPDSPVEFFKKVATKLDHDQGELVQEAFNDTQKMIFVVAMNDAGHTNFDAKRTAIVYSGDKGHEVYTPKQQYNMLSKKERQLIKQPREERLFIDISHRFEHGNSAATLRISLHTSGNVWYDPSEHVVRGDITPSEYDAVYASLYPKITPESSHEDMLEIRRQAQALVKELGFPEPSIFGF